MGFVVYEKRENRGGLQWDIASANRLRRKPQPLPGNCPVCEAPLPVKPPSLRRRYCSRACAGMAKRR